MINNNSPTMAQVLQALGLTSADIEELGGAKVDLAGLMESASVEPAWMREDYEDLSPGMTHEVYTLVAFMKVNKIFDVAALDVEDYMKKRGELASVSQELVEWYGKVSVPNRGRMDTLDFVPTITTFILNWELGIHDFSSLISNASKIGSASDHVHRLQLGEIAAVANDLEKHCDLVGVRSFQGHSPDSFFKGVLADFLSRLDFSDDEVEIVLTAFCGFHYLTLVKWRYDFIYEGYEICKIRREQRLRVVEAIDRMERQHDMPMTERLQSYQPTM